MRLAFALVLLLPSLVHAQPSAEQKKETAKWVTDLQAPDGGFFVGFDSRSDIKPVPSLRATSAAVRALKYLGADIPNKEKHAAFVLKCFDAKTGGFAEPGGKPDVTITSIGVMAAVELGIPKEKFAKSMDYLKENAKTFEDVRIGAAAVEAWGVKDCPFKLSGWENIATLGNVRENELLTALSNPKDGGARIWGSHTAFLLRLGKKIPGSEGIPTVLDDGQLDDGGWGKDKKSSDIETTYRVMRAYVLLKQKPKNVKKLREFVDSHRNKDGGYAAKPGDKSNVGPTYYCVIISKWLDEMEK